MRAHVRKAQRLPAARQGAAAPPVAAGRARFEAWCRALFEPVDAAPVVYFRIAFGLIMVWEVCRFFNNGWIDRYYVDPVFNFKYLGFGWVRPWPAPWIHVHFGALGVLAGCVAAGAFYRVAAPLFCAGFVYVFLLEQARYLNHLYLVALVAFLMALVPAHRAFSVDAWHTPAIRSLTVPRWSVWVLRFQIAVAYLFSGIAKLNGDWLAGEPVRSWLAEASTETYMVGPYLSNEWAVMLICYGGLLYDLSIVPLLLWRRTWAVAFACTVFFHLTNAQLFPLGIFPWFMLAATAILFTPRWPRFAPPRAFTRPKSRRTAAAPLPLNRRHRAALACMGVYVAVQILLPLRHFLYPGDVNWTEEGHRWSWHMMLRDKEATAWYFATDPDSGQTWEISSRTYLAPWQSDRMESRPDMVLQFAHFLADRVRQEGHPHGQIRAQVKASLNGRALQDLIDPAVDLAAQPRSLWPASWIVPLTTAPPGHIANPAQADDVP